MCVPESPGVKNEDLEVSVSGNTLAVRGETEHEEKEEKGDYHLTEISRGALVRTPTLPAYPAAKRCMVCRQRHEKTCAHAGTPKF